MSTTLAPNPLKAYSTSAVAKLLGVSAGKLRAWIATGELEAVNLSAVRGQRPQWRITQVALDDFLRRRTSAPQSKAARMPRAVRPLENVIEFF